uniref:Uncharacterized protein n=1 Tax=Populus alba TaxID=43335 RepID=A0A4U5Q850_POPAL|nr:hypothetical protein D5086_0000124110 [Populus alba]
MQVLLTFVIIQSLSSIESLQYTFLEATAPAHHSEAACATLPPSFSALLSDSCTEHSAATLAPLPASISAHLSCSCTKAKQEPVTMPLPCDPSFQIRGCMTGSSFNGQ